MSDPTNPAMPSIQQIHEKVMAAHRAPDASTGVGGTTSDPSLAAPVEAPAASKDPDAAPETTEKAKVDEKKPDPASSRFGALARKEKEMRAKAEETQKRLADLENREKALQEREHRLAAAKTNPLKVLKEYGFSYQDATEAVLGNYQEPEEDPVDAKLRSHTEKYDKYESSIAKLEEQLTELRNRELMKQQQESMAQVVSGINDALKDDKFEIVRAMGSDGVDFVKDIMVEYYKTHERLLDYSEACQVAEEYYEKEYLSRLLETKKLKARLPQAKPAPESKAASAKPTLTNNLATGTGATKDIDQMSKNEAIEYLARKLQYKQS